MDKSLNLAYESCGYVMEKLNQWKIRQNQAEKESQMLLMIDRYKVYASKIEGFHQMLLDVKWMQWVFQLVQEQ